MKDNIYGQQHNANRITPIKKIGTKTIIVENDIPLNTDDTDNALGKAAHDKRSVVADTGNNAFAGDFRTKEARDELKLYTKKGELDKRTKEYKAIAKQKAQSEMGVEKKEYFISEHQLNQLPEGKFDFINMDWEASSSVYSNYSNETNEIENMNQDQMNKALDALAHIVCEIVKQLEKNGKKHSSTPCVAVFEHRDAKQILLGINRNSDKESVKKAVDMVFSSIIEDQEGVKKGIIRKTLGESFKEELGVLINPLFPIEPQDAIKESRYRSGIDSKKSGSSKNAGKKIKQYEETKVKKVVSQSSKANKAQKQMMDEEDSSSIVSQVNYTNLGSAINRFAEYISFLDKKNMSALYFNKYKIIDGSERTDGVYNGDTHAEVNVLDYMLNYMLSHPDYMVNLYAEYLMNDGLAPNFYIGNNKRACPGCDISMEEFNREFWMNIEYLGAHNNFLGVLFDQASQNQSHTSEFIDPLYALPRYMEDKANYLKVFLNLKSNKHNKNEDQKSISFASKSTFKQSNPQKKFQQVHHESDDLIESIKHLSFIDDYEHNYQIDYLRKGRFIDDTEVNNQTSEARVQKNFIKMLGASKRKAMYEKAKVKDFASGLLKKRDEIKKKQQEDKPQKTKEELILVKLIADYDFDEESFEIVNGDLHIKDLVGPSYEVNSKIEQFEEVLNSSIKEESTFYQQRGKKGKQEQKKVTFNDIKLSAESFKQEAFDFQQAEQEAEQELAAQQKVEDKALLDKFLQKLRESDSIQEFLKFSNNKNFGSLQIRGLSKKDIKKDINSKNKSTELDPVGNGNCFYASFLNTQNLGQIQQLRDDVARHIENNENQYFESIMLEAFSYLDQEGALPDFFTQNFLIEARIEEIIQQYVANGNFDGIDQNIRGDIVHGYANHIRQDRAWAGDIEINIAAEIRREDIIIHNAGNNPTTNITHNNANTIHMYYTGNHYMRLADLNSDQEEESKANGIVSHLDGMSDEDITQNLIMLKEYAQFSNDVYTETKIFTRDNIIEIINDFSDNESNQNHFLGIATVINSEKKKHAIAVHVQRIGKIIKITLIDPLSCSDSEFQNELLELQDALSVFAGVSYQVYTGRQDSSSGTCGDMSLLELLSIYEQQISRDIHGTNHNTSSENNQVEEFLFARESDEMRENRELLEGIELMSDEVQSIEVNYQKDNEILQENDTKTTLHSTDINLHPEIMEFNAADVLKIIPMQNSDLITGMFWVE